MNGINCYPIVRTEGTKIIFKLNTEKMGNEKAMAGDQKELSRDNWFSTQLNRFSTQLNRFRGINVDLDQISENLTNSTRRLGGAFEKPTEDSPTDEQANTESNLYFLEMELRRLTLLVKSLSDASIRLNELT